MSHLCPRRDEIPSVFKVSESDSWDGGFCSFCGSIHPDAFMEMSASGQELVPTDKDYKVYVPGGKFYFQHLSKDQRKSFVDLINSGKLNLGTPGRFYVLPFFVTRGP